MNAPMTFSWSSTEREKQSVLRAQPFDSGSQRQVIALNALSKNLAGQVLFFRKRPSIAPPLISGQHSDIKGCEQCQQFATGFIGTWAKSAGQYATRFCVVRVPEPVLLRLAANEAPLLIKFTDKHHISMGYRR